jgi:hypothetical protein
MKLLQKKIALVTGASRGVGILVNNVWGSYQHYTESPQFIGRAVAALAADPNIMDKSGQILVAAALAQEYNFSDIDGNQPTPLTWTKS